MTNVVIHKPNCYLYTIAEVKQETANKVIFMLHDNAYLLCELQQLLIFLQAQLDTGWLFELVAHKDEQHFAIHDIRLTPKNFH